MSEVVPGASVPEYSGNPSGNTPGSDAPGSDAPDQRPALSPQSTAAIAAAKKRRRGRRGGRNRNRTSASGTRTQSSDANRVENDSVESDDVNGGYEDETADNQTSAVDTSSTGTVRVGGDARPQQPPRRACASECPSHRALPASRPRRGAARNTCLTVTQH